MTLKDVVSFHNGKSAEFTEHGTIKVFGSNGEIGFTDKVLFDEGIIIGRVGAYCGAIVTPKEPFWASDNTIVVKPKNSIDLAFISYYLSGLNLNWYAGGSAQPLLTHGWLKPIKVKIPELSVQKKISNILSAYDELIENNLKRIELLEEQAQIIYEEWFVRMKFPNHESTAIDSETGLPEGWKVIPLSKIAKINAKSLTSDFDDYISYIDISCVSTRSIDDTVDYHIDAAPGRAKRVLSHGDIIWSCVRPNRKSYALVWKPEENTIASTGFAVITPSKVPTSFLYQVLGNDHFVGYLNNRAMGAAYPAVKAIDFKQYVVTLPPKSLIDDFDKQVKDNLELIWNLNKQNKLLKEARDILLPRLMTGMIEV